MFAVIDQIQDQFGNGQANWQFELVDPVTLAVIPLYSDYAGAIPIGNTSYITNRAVSDAYGNVQCYVAEGVYTKRVYKKDGTLYRVTPYITYGGDSSIRRDLAATTVGNGLALIGDSTSSTNAQVSMDARMKSATLAATDGAALVGFTQSGTGAVARTVQAELRDRVSVKQFGAVGDNATDDTAALNAAYTAAEAIGGAEVYWPAGTYKTTGTVTCGPLSSTRAAAGAVLAYSGTGTAFEVQGVNTSETNGQFHVLPYINRSALNWNSGTDTTSIGLILGDRKYNTFVIPGVRRFNTGVALKANTTNFVCNTLQLGVIQNNRLGIDFSRVTAGWGINQNTFTGGAIAIDSAYTSAANRIYVNMPDVENNGNTFIGVNLEKGGNEKAIICAAAENVFLNCRYEGSSSTLGYITLSGNRNKIIGGAPSSAPNLPFEIWISDTGFGNQYWMGYSIASKYFSLDFSTGNGPLKFGNGTASPAVPIGAYGTDRIALGNSNTTAFRYWGLAQQESAAITTGTTLPWKNALVLNYGSATTITGMSVTLALTDTSAIVAITSLNGNATLQHTGSPSANAAKFVLKGGANLTLTANTPVLFQLVGGNLYQI